MPLVRLTPKQWQQVIELLPLAKSAIRNTGARGNPDELLWDKCLEALAYAVRGYRAERGKLSTWAYNACAQALTKKPRTLWAANPPGEIDEACEPCAFERIGVDSDMLQRLYNSVQRLSEYDRLLVVMKWWQELTYEEIGDAVGVSKSTAYLHCGLAFERLRAGVVLHAPA